MVTHSDALRRLVATLGYGETQSNEAASLRQREGRVPTAPPLAKPQWPGTTWPPGEKCVRNVSELPRTPFDQMDTTRHFRYDSLTGDY